MARRKKRQSDDVLGNSSLASFDFCIIGSGAGGGSAAHVLTAAGKTVLVLEAGHNAFPGLDDPKELQPTLHSNDELKYTVRDYIGQDAFLDPRVFRGDPGRDGSLEGDVNTLPRAVGGAFQHADAKTPRFNEVDFRLKSAIEALIAATPGLLVPGFNDGPAANFADWPFTYDELEPFYTEAELLYGVQGKQGDNVFESARSRPYPMPPGVPMYLSLLLSDGAKATQLPGYGALTPHTYPGAIASRPYGDGPNARPPCVDCGLCSGFGCPNHAKGSPAVTTLRRALLSGKCQLRFNATVAKLMNDGSHVSGVEYIDASGAKMTATADRYILAASPIESARLCLLSDPGTNPDRPGLGNAASGQLGQNLMFHLQTNVNGFMAERIHGQRGRAVTHGISDFRGVEPGGNAIRVFDDGQGGKVVALGGICEFGASQGLPISEDGANYSQTLAPFAGTRLGAKLKNVMRDLPLGQHLLGLTMQAEDAPQRSNAVDLDRRYTDVFGRPVVRITYANHAFEKNTRKFYLPLLRQVVENAGTKTLLVNGVPRRSFVTPCDPAAVGPPSSRHIMGTLRMGTDPATSVTNADGKFWDVDNLYCVDGAVFPTSSGYNPTLTIFASALRIAHRLAGTPPAI